mmetsp:Transcript_56071/g.121255  ORF Transcript_56071/g.121255 Transcript_56071/m.121255 type:complete len:104 (-) Transcript_56071:562-873(-)
MLPQLGLDPSLMQHHHPGRAQYAVMPVPLPATSQKAPSVLVAEESAQQLGVPMPLAAYRQIYRPAAMAPPAAKVPARPSAAAATGAEAAWEETRPGAAWPPRR